MHTAPQKNPEILSWNIIIEIIKNSLADYLNKSIQSFTRSTDGIGITPSFIKISRLNPTRFFDFLAHVTAAVKVALDKGHNQWFNVIVTKLHNIGLVAEFLLCFLSLFQIIYAYIYVSSLVIKFLLIATSFFIV